MSTLSTLSNLATSRTHDRQVNAGQSSSFLSYILPSAQGQGPIASAMRIAMKLRHQSWIPSTITDYFAREIRGGRRKDNELAGRAIKVIDLLQHAAELGNTDALYTLAQISLVCFIQEKVDLPVPGLNGTVVSRNVELPCSSLKLERWRNAAICLLLLGSEAPA